jgi:hypothetical protein
MYKGSDSASTTGSGGSGRLEKPWLWLCVGAFLSPSAAPPVPGRSLGDKGRSDWLRLTGLRQPSLATTSTAGTVAGLVVGTECCLT